MDNVSTLPSKTAENDIRAKRTHSRHVRHVANWSPAKDTNKLTPFHVRWCYGANTKVRPISLMTRNRKIIFYVAAHAAILYECEQKDSRLLNGHKNPINSTSCDLVGKFVVTSDYGEDNVVIVWDTIDCIPIFNLFSPHGEYYVQITALSLDAKYLITIGNEPQPKILFWLWSYGREQPDDTYCVDLYDKPQMLGAAKFISFNEQVVEHFLFTFEHLVLFGVWEDTKMRIHIPKNQPKGKGLYTASTYISNCHNAVTATTAGYVIVWGNTIYKTSFHNVQELSNDKEFIKAVKMSQHAITAIENIDGILAIGDAGGVIGFYDFELKMLYWIQNLEITGVQSLSFDPSDSYFQFKSDDSLDDDNCDNCTPTVWPKDEVIKHLPSDTTIERKPFAMRNFLITTVSGQIIYYNFMEQNYEYVVDVGDGTITTIATHVDKNVLLIGSISGRIEAYNVVTHALVADYTLPHINIILANGDIVQRPQRIAKLVFSPHGLHLACGMDGGRMWLLDPTTLKPLIDKPFKVVKGTIMNIHFSSDCKFMAVYGRLSNVCLLKLNEENPLEWNIVAKYKPHYKPIAEMLFSANPADQYPMLYTFGRDRHFFQIDIERSVSENEIVIVNKERIEQSAIPQCAIWYPGDSNIKTPSFLAATDQYKYKIYDASTGMVLRTALGPTFGNHPVKMMRVLPGRKYLVYASKKIIGIQKIPPDGNPYKYVALIGHPTELENICISADGKNLFTLGKNDTCVLQWSINVRSVEVMANIGGEDIQPYYLLIDGGEKGNFYNEMKDFFYYMQILHQGEITPDMRKVSHEIPVYQLPDYMRAIGCYLTEYEIENMLFEVKYLNKKEQGFKEAKIDFESVVKLYVNHRPAFHFSNDSLKAAFDYLVEMNNDGSATQKCVMTRAAFLDTLCYNGEMIPEATLLNYLKILLHHQDLDTTSRDVPVESGLVFDEINFSFLPNEIGFDDLLTEILGVSIEDPEPEEVNS